MTYPSEKMKKNGLPVKKEIISLQLKLSQEERAAMLNRYHYEEKDLEMLTHLYYAIEPAISPWCEIQYEPGYAFTQEKEYVVVLVSLGSGIDRITDAYEEAGCITEAYMLDCIGLELLKKVYKQVEVYMKENLHIIQLSLEFIGDKYPLECMREIVKDVDQITCNEAYMLSPRKSTIYLAKVCEQEQLDYEMGQTELTDDICRNCSNVNCTNRVSSQHHYTYGYQTIFGKKD